MAESGAARYFQSVFSACRLSAGHGVPLHTLMLITATKRMYLVNGYSVFKELSRFLLVKKNGAKVFALHPIVLESTRNIRCLQNIFQFFSKMPHTEIYGTDRQPALFGNFRAVIAVLNE